MQARVARAGLEEDALFAARRDFELLRLLAASDRRTQVLARRFGFMRVCAQRPGSLGASPRPARPARAGSAEAAGAPAPAPRPPRKPARKRGQRERRQRQASATLLQSAARRFLARRAFLRARAGVTRFQALWRGYTLGICDDALGYSGDLGTIRRANWTLQAAFRHGLNRRHFRRALAELRLSAEDGPATQPMDDEPEPAALEAAPNPRGKRRMSTAGLYPDAAEDPAAARTGSGNAA